MKCLLLAWAWPCACGVQAIIVTQTMKRPGHQKVPRVAGWVVSWGGQGAQASETKRGCDVGIPISQLGPPDKSAGAASTRRSLSCILGWKPKIQVLARAGFSCGRSLGSRRPSSPCPACALISSSCGATRPAGNTPACAASRRNLCHLFKGHVSRVNTGEVLGVSGTQFSP